VDSRNTMRSGGRGRVRGSYPFGRGGF